MLWKLEKKLTKYVPCMDSEEALSGTCPKWYLSMDPRMLGPSAWPPTGRSGLCKCRLLHLDSALALKLLKNGKIWPQVGVGFIQWPKWQGPVFMLFDATNINAETAAFVRISLYVAWSKCIHNMQGPCFSLSVNLPVVYILATGADGWSTGVGYTLHRLPVSHKAQPAQYTLKFKG